MQQPPAGRVDWTGVRLDDRSIEPLDGRTFVARLHRLEECARDLMLLRKARTEQQSHDERVPQDTERAPRPAR